MNNMSQPFTIEANRLLPMPYIRDVFVPQASDPEPLGTFWILTQDKLYQGFAPVALNQNVILVFPKIWNDRRLAQWLGTPTRYCLITERTVLVILPSHVSLVLPDGSVFHVERPADMPAAWGYSYE